MSQYLTARAAGLLDCRVCHLLVRRPAQPEHRLACPRCGSTLHQRKPDSIARTWALLLAAMFLYIPAMALPIMETITITGARADTVLSGIVYLMTTGMWPLAAIVFFASMVVPVLKILGLSFLLVSVQRGSAWRTRDRARLYRISEAVGRWSMVDIYVVTVMVALVRLRALAVVEARTGALFFAAVVVVTMLAAMSFDPRLIWDRLEPRE
jgi:paraquat-inducible protein A